ncbi:MAG: hypothetical protein IBX67_07945 [Dehalococcoidia bacterium]|nr:hypothetical protein [Dehalococcoidia bacterium]
MPCSPGSSCVRADWLPWWVCEYRRTWVLLREGRFIPTRDELAGYLPGADDREVIRIARDWHGLEQDREERPSYYIGLLERWSRSILLRL